MPCGSKPRTPCTVVADRAENMGAWATRAVAKAHKVLDTSCGRKALARGRIHLSARDKKKSSVWLCCFSVATAQTKFDKARGSSSCHLRPLWMCCIAACRNGALCRKTANAQVTFTRPCMENSSMRASTSAARRASSASWPAAASVARLHATEARSCSVSRASSPSDDSKCPAISPTSGCRSRTVARLQSRFDSCCGSSTEMRGSAASAMSWKKRLEPTLAFAKDQAVNDKYLGSKTPCRMYGLAVASMLVSNTTDFAKTSSGNPRSMESRTTPHAKQARCRPMS
mmetsp:Transcript_17912/g.49696  ORF Transcript_17912/g.49696 Transcript_17912/m.49696 type:complete len:285 (+) Transcript_17912:398-1252(+)